MSSLAQQNKNKTSWEEEAKRSTLTFFWHTHPVRHDSRTASSERDPVCGERKDLSTPPGAQRRAPRRARGAMEKWNISRYPVRRGQNAATRANEKREGNGIEQKSSNVMPKPNKNETSRIGGSKVETLTFYKTQFDVKCRTARSHRNPHGKGKPVGMQHEW